MFYYVSQNNTHNGSGTKSDPFKTIGQAADLAMPGDTIVIGKAFESEQSYENRDGSPISVDSDFEDQPRGKEATIGPFEHYCDRIQLI